MHVRERLPPQLELEERHEDAVRGTVVRRREVRVEVPPLDQRRRVRQVVHRQIEWLMARRPIGLVERELHEGFGELEPGVAPLVRPQGQPTLGVQ